MSVTAGCDLGAGCWVLGGGCFGSGDAEQPPVRGVESTASFRWRTQGSGSLPTGELLQRACGKARSPAGVTRGYPEKRVHSMPIGHRDGIAGRDDQRSNKVTARLVNFTG